MKAVLRKIRISPKKANLVAGMVRGKKVNDALALLKFMPKKGAEILYKVVQSAASNAKNNFKQNIDDLVITRLLVTKGQLISVLYLSLVDVYTLFVRELLILL